MAATVGGIASFGGRKSWRRMASNGVADEGVEAEMETEMSPEANGTCLRAFFLSYDLSVASSCHG